MKSTLYYVTFQEQFLPHFKWSLRAAVVFSLKELKQLKKPYSKNVERKAFQVTKYKKSL